MKRELTFAAVVVAFVAVSASAQKFRPVDERVPFGHYLIRLADTVQDPAAAAAEMARTFGGRLEPFAAEGFRGFAIVMTPAHARQLSSDPRVIDVEEQGGRTAPPAAVHPAPARTAAAGMTHPGVAAAAPALPVATPRVNTFGAGSWSSGAYAYDGAGNITAIGTDAYAYDSVGRLLSGTVDVSNSQSYSYDSFGNRLSATTQGAPCVDAVTCGGTVAVDWKTNRVSDHNAVYDDAGDLTAYDPKSQATPFTYTYDGAGMITSITAPDHVVYEYIYTATDERLATNTNQGSWRFTVRDLNGTVVREVDAYAGSSGTSWQWERDHVFRGGSLLATVSATGTEQFHLDHLGTPRVVTNAAGEKIGYHAYYPFGEELDLASREIPEERLKFTGHERDSAGSGALDYMHARYFGAPAGRFLTADPVLGKANQPQSWNRFVYCFNNPIGHADADGRWPDWIDKRVAAAEKWWNGTKTRAAEQAKNVAHIAGSITAVHAGVAISGSSSKASGSIGMEVSVDTRTDNTEHHPVKVSFTLAVQDGSSKAGGSADIVVNREHAAHEVVHEQQTVLINGREIGSSEGNTAGGATVGLSRSGTPEAGSGVSAVPGVWADGLIGGVIDIAPSAMKIGYEQAKATAEAAISPFIK